jgi:hypothetical protein
VAVVKPKEVAELLLSRMNRLQVNNGFFGASSGTIGSINILQKDMNRALELLQTSGDVSGLGQVALTLRTYGNLTDVEYEQIMEALDGEK